MNYSVIKNCDIANGEGVRVSLFVSGCNHHCPGCFNKETWDFNYGKHFTNETIMEIIEMLKPDYINGLTILGGEPLDPKNIVEVYRLIMSVRHTYSDKKTIWIYTGYTWSELMSRVRKYHNNNEVECDSDLVLSHLLSETDVLVDGRFIEDEKDISLVFRGSKNQNLISCKESLRDTIKTGYNCNMIYFYPDIHFKM